MHSRQRCPLPATNKRFLRNVLVSTLEPRKKKPKQAGTCVIIPCMPIWPQKKFRSGAVYIETKQINIHCKFMCIGSVNPCIISIGCGILSNSFYLFSVMVYTQACALSSKIRLVVALHVFVLESSIKCNIFSLFCHRYRVL